MPAFKASATPSATPRYVPQRITWLTALATCPRSERAKVGDGAAHGVEDVVRPFHVSTSPPTMIVNVPAAAPSEPPDTGASSMATPQARKTLPHLAGAGGADRRAVDEQRPGAEALRQPVGAEEHLGHLR